jgi:hypothetical protein
MNGRKEEWENGRFESVLTPEIRGKKKDEEKTLI